jgi:hypothetical protein
MNIDAVKRQIEESIPWRDGVLTVEQAFALVAEVERLRAVVADQQMLLDEHRMDNQHAYEEGGHAERAAVVAWLRDLGDQVPVARDQWIADCIERGEHRREEEP